MIDEDVRGNRRLFCSFTMANGCAQGTLKFHVKWEGYEKKSDMTWEPEENLKYVPCVVGLLDDSATDLDAL